MTSSPEPSSPTLVLVSTQHGWHGGEGQAKLLAVGLRQRGWRCVMLARRDGALAERMAAEGFEVVTFSGGGRRTWRTVENAARRCGASGRRCCTTTIPMPSPARASHRWGCGDGDRPNFRPSENGTVPFASAARSPAAALAHRRPAR